MGFLVGLETYCNLQNWFFSSQCQQELILELDSKNFVSYFLNHLHNRRYYLMILNVPELKLSVSRSQSAQSDIKEAIPHGHGEAVRQNGSSVNVNLQQVLQLESRYRCTVDYLHVSFIPAYLKQGSLVVAQNFILLNLMFAMDQQSQFQTLKALENSIEILLESTVNSQEFNHFNLEIQKSQPLKQLLKLLNTITYLCCYSP